MVLYKRKKIRFIVSIAVLLFLPLFGNAATTEESEEEILFITSYNSDTKYTYDNISTFIETYTQLGGRYSTICYGTLRSEVERIWAKGNIIVFDVDVIGGINLKRIFGGDACSIFVMPPSVEELRRRLEGRGTDAPEVIDRRVAKAEFELTKAPEFDHIVVNDSLDEAIAETTRIIDEFITGRS